MLEIIGRCSLAFLFIYLLGCYIMKLAGRITLIDGGGGGIPCLLPIAEGGTFGLPASTCNQHIQGFYFLEEVMKLFSMHRTTKAFLQLLLFCSSSLPDASEEAWPVTTVSSVRHVSQ